MFYIFTEAVSWRFSVRKGVFRNFEKFTGKHLCQSFFFNKVAASACNFIKKETLAQAFSYELSEISKSTSRRPFLYLVSSNLHQIRLRLRLICQIWSRKVVKFSHAKPNM